MIRRALTGNDVRPLTNSERRAAWAAKYFLVPEEQRKMIGFVCAYCGAASEGHFYDADGRRYCTPQHRILGERDRAPTPAPKRDEDEQDQAARGVSGNW